MADFTWKIGGPAGFGIMTTGFIFSKAFSRGGYHVFGCTEFPSLIRGGHNTYQSRVSSEEIHSQNKPVHILVALNRETIEKNSSELAENGAIIYDGEMIKDAVEGNSISVPFARLAKESCGKELMANSVSLGASVALLGYDIEMLNSVIKDVFREKGEDVVNANINSAKAGYDYVKGNCKKTFAITAKKISGPRKYLLTGNDAIGAGAIAAGCRFYSGYPMTPTAQILSYMAQHQKGFGIAVKLAEDEIAAVNNAVGAGFAGARAMTATAGGGFALMAEGYGLAAMTETPVVIVVGQRPGPATGMPTWSSQADLRFVLHAHQDDFPRIVIAPGDAEEAFRMAGEAHNIAEAYQTPVIMLVDKYLCESQKTAEKLEGVKIDRGELLEEFKGEYERYKLTKTGISPRILPGTKGAVVIANSDEHNEKGQSTEDAALRRKMMEKRMKKLEMFAKEMPQPKAHGHSDAEITLVCFGSVKGPALEAIKELKKKGVNSNMIHLTYISPFPEKEMKKLLKSAKKLLIVENNFTGQLAGLIREKTGKNITKKLLKYDGRPFYPEEIAEKAMKVLGK